MTSAWEDTPGSTLASDTEAIGFTSDRAITEIRALYREELVYSEAGGFVAPFTASTKNGGATAFQVRRTNGWPRDFKLLVEETPEPPPTGGQTWGAIYQVNLTTQATQSMTAAGSYTIDGKAWWAKGTLWASGVNGLVNGSGLRLFAPATVGGAQPDRPNFRTSTSGITQRVLFFPFAQLSGYNANAPVYVMWRMAHTLSGDQDRCYSAGMMSAASSSAAITNGERQSCAQVCHFNFATSQTAICGVAGNQNPTDAIVNDSDASHYQRGVLRFARDRMYVLGAPWSGAFVTPESSALSFSGNGGYIEADSHTAPGFFFTLHKAFSDGQTLDVYLTDLLISQPRI